MLKLAIISKTWKGLLIDSQLTNINVKYLRKKIFLLHCIVIYDIYIEIYLLKRGKDKIKKKSLTQPFLKIRLYVIFSFMKAMKNVYSDINGVSSKDILIIMTNFNIYFRFKRIQLKNIL